MWESFIEAVTKVNDWVNGVVWGWPMIIMILGTGILLTVRTRVLQVRKFGESMSTTIVPAVKDMGKKKNKKAACLRGKRTGMTGSVADSPVCYGTG